MDFSQFNAALQRKATEVQQAIKNELAVKVTALGLRFIDDNFRNQGWEGTAWPKSKEDGTTLVDSGALKRGFNTERRDGEIRFYNTVEYGQVHNEGFEGTIDIPEHTRSKYKRSGQRRTRTSTGTVKAHKRKVSITKRQFAPYAGNESKTLNEQVQKTVDKIIIKILNNE